MLVSRRLILFASAWLMFLLVFSVILVAQAGLNTYQYLPQTGDGKAIIPTGSEDFSEDPSEDLNPTAALYLPSPTPTSAPRIPPVILDPHPISSDIQSTTTVTSTTILLSPAFRQFVDQTVSRQSEADKEHPLVRGVYVENVFALPVVQQPINEINYVSAGYDDVTQFQAASYHNVIGLLAHNYLAGILFYNLALDQEIRIVNGDGSFRSYRVSEIHQYQKLTPGSVHSDLIDLVNGEKLTTDQAFDRYYAGSHHVTLQTCLERDGLLNWGLTFIVAVPQ
jgi:hypothetical protein